MGGIKESPTSPACILILFNKSSIMFYPSYTYKSNS
nr:MAG TPA: hypothetical protein [Caudoviricetes sp.]